MTTTPKPKTEDEMWQIYADRDCAARLAGSKPDPSDEKEYKPPLNGVTRFVCERLANISEYDDRSCVFVRDRYILEDGTELIYPVILEIDGEEFYTDPPSPRPLST